MKRVLISFFLISFAFLSIFVLYNTFISFRYQLILRQDSDARSYSLTKEEIEDIPFFPNISITTLPIESMKAKYYIYNGELAEGIKLLKQGASVNPYIFYSDYLLAHYYLEMKNTDSAYYHSKKALYGWPKNIDHYKLFNKILEIKKDTTEILDTYDYINSVFNTKEQHQQSFIDSYSNAKLRYLIFKYPDERTVSVNDIFGSWQQIYEFETGEISKISNTILIDNKYFYSNNMSKYRYSLTNDTLNLFFTTNNKLISQIPIFYSDSLKTLILKNLPRSVIDDNPELQDQFFKKIN